MGQIMANLQQRCCNPSRYYERIQLDEDIQTYKNFKKIQEDSDYYYEERWFAVIDPLLFEPEKFIFVYHDYKQHQVNTRDPARARRLLHCSVRPAMGTGSHAPDGLNAVSSRLIFTFANIS